MSRMRRHIDKYGSSEDVGSRRRAGS
jgi:hypothetical protein